MDIGSNGKWPSCALSNFTSHEFTKLRDRLRQSVHPKFDLVGTKQEEP